MPTSLVALRDSPNPCIPPHRRFEKKKQAEEEIAKARRRGIHIREAASRRSDKVAQNPDPDADPPSRSYSQASQHSFRGAPPNVSSYLEVVEGSTERELECYAYDEDDDEEGGVPVLPSRGGGGQRRRRRALLVECRDRSRSAWLYFPHIELLFLLFAFEGALASELAALREGGCPWMFHAAWVSLVSRPGVLSDKKRLEKYLFWSTTLALVARRAIAISFSTQRTFVLTQKIVRAVYVPPCPEVHEKISLLSSTWGAMSVPSRIGIFLPSTTMPLYMLRIASVP